jgi:Bacterial protein of unknown function (DUF899)
MKRLAFAGMELKKIFCRCPQRRASVRYIFAQALMMNYPQIVSREEWLVARRELLAHEKQLTRQRDALNAKRRRLPMVKVESYS